MEGVDDLLGGLAGGDKAPVETGGLKREQDSTDDFEHLERDGRRSAGESPSRAVADRHVTHSFLETERGSPADHLADKFTDSESDGTVGESPLHRPQVPPPAVPAFDPTPILAPVPAPVESPVVPPVSQPPPPPPHVHETPLVPMKPEPEPPKQEVPKVEVPKKEAPKAPQPPPAEPVKPVTRPAHVIEAEVIFCQMGLDAWFDPQRLHPKVESVLYWRNPAVSGGVLGAGLALLIALACCSVVSVVAYVALLVLSAAVAFRLYKNVLQAVQKTNEGHPFKAFLETDVSVSAERTQQLAASTTAHLNAAIAELRRLFLVEDLVDSLKFGVLLWCLTYIGAAFNGITLIILAWIGAFTLPKAYEMNKSQVDSNLELARAKINEITAKIRAAVPLGKKAESEKDK